MAGIELVHQLRRSPAGTALRIVVIDRQAAHGYIRLAHERLCLRLPISTSVLATAQQVENAGYRYVLDLLELVGGVAGAKVVAPAAQDRRQRRDHVADIDSEPIAAASGRGCAATGISPTRDAARPITTTARVGALCSRSPPRAAADEYGRDRRLAQLLRDASHQSPARPTVSCATPYMSALTFTIVAH
jgi:hypothetical protein